MDRETRSGRGFLAAVTVCGIVSCSLVFAQQAKTKGKPDAGRTTDPAAATATPEEQPIIKATRHLTSPNEPVALINGEPITRQQLADECVARKGKEILETLMARKLIEQAIRAKKIEITPGMIDTEISRVAQNMAGLSREEWLKALAKERDISPAQYARDIIYPTLALRELSKNLPEVTVTEKDINEAFEQTFGEKLQCKMIMLPTELKAKSVWEVLKEKPEFWDRLVLQESIDQATRAVGGMLNEPIARHSEPRSVSDAAFKALVDIDPSVDTKNPIEYAKYKPKDGDITGAIQIPTGDGTATAWVILKRVSVVPAKPYDRKDKMARKKFEEMIRDTKIQRASAKLFDNLWKAAAVENKLTGTTKMAYEEEHPDSRLDKNVELMSNPDGAVPRQDDSPKADSSGRARVAPPPGVSSKDVKDIEAIKRK
jgi:foldase protein PrsA